VRAGPVLLDDLRTRAADDAAKHKRDKHGIVELACDRDEVRDEIEREQQVRDERDEQQLVATAYPVVGEQSPKEDDAVGNEACDRACVLATPEKDEHENEAGVGEHHGADDCKTHLDCHGLQRNRESAHDRERLHAEHRAVTSFEALAETGPHIPPVRRRNQAVLALDVRPAGVKRQPRPHGPRAENLLVVPPELHVVIAGTGGRAPREHRRRGETGAVRGREEVGRPRDRRDRDTVGPVARFVDGNDRVGVRDVVIDATIDVLPGRAAVDLLLGAAGACAKNVDMVEVGVGRRLPPERDRAVAADLTSPGGVRSTGVGAAGGSVRPGGPTTTVIDDDAVVAFLEASVPVNLTAVVPRGKLEGASEITFAPGSTRSVARAAARNVLIVGSVAGTGTAPAATVIRSGAGTLRRGGVESITRRTNEAVALTPRALVAVQATVVEPRPKAEPLAGLQIVACGGNGRPASSAVTAKVATAPLGPVASNTGPAGK
jgi:hypothetical protein